MADAAVASGGGEDFLRDDLAGGGGEIFEGVAQLLLAGLARLFCNFSRRSGLFGFGGLGLFWRVLDELQEELVCVELFAFGSVEALEEFGDDGVFGRELGF